MNGAPMTSDPRAGTTDEASQHRSEMALVVGGTRGIGRAVCLNIASRYARIAVMYRSDEAAAGSVAQEIERRGAEPLLLKADIRDADLVATMVNQSAADYGRLDLLVHCAGSLTDWQPVRDLTPTAWRQYIDSDLNGFFNVVNAALRIMHEQKSGNIVAVTSISSRAASPFSSQSAAAKAGVEAMIRVIAREEGRFGIRANAVAAGLTDTEQGQHAIEHWGAETAKRIIQQSAIPRIGTADEVARVVAFLASPDASYVTGRILAADGGQFISA